jgi:hypothetical protein
MRGAHGYQALAKGGGDSGRNSGGLGRAEHCDV